MILGRTSTIVGVPEIDCRYVDRIRKKQVCIRKLNVETLIEFVHYPSSSTCVKINVDSIDRGGMVLKKQKKFGMCPKKLM